MAGAPHALKGWCEAGEHMSALPLRRAMVDEIAVPAAEVVHAAPKDQQPVALQVDEPAPATVPLPPRTPAEASGIAEWTRRMMGEWGHEMIGEGCWGTGKGASVRAMPQPDARFPCEAYFAARLAVSRNMLVPYWVMSAWAYEHGEAPLVSDVFFDYIAEALGAEWDSIEHAHKGRINRDCVKTAIAWDGPWPSMAIGAARTLLRNGPPDRSVWDAPAEPSPVDRAAAAMVSKVLASPLAGAPAEAPKPTPIMHEEPKIMHAQALPAVTIAVAKPAPYTGPGEQLALF